MKEILTVIIGILAGTVIGFGLLGLIWWGIGSIVVWAFGINFAWTFWHGLVVAILSNIAKSIFTIRVKKEN